MEALNLPSRGNLVAVISNGTAVLRLGNIGAVAGKPVMEGKACLFKKFAGIDVFDIEIDETDPNRLVDIIASLEPTFGAINLGITNMTALAAVASGARRNRRNTP